MGFGLSAGDPVLNERQADAASPVHGFKTTGIVSEEGSTWCKDCRVKGTATAADEHRCGFEQVKLFCRKAQRAPVHEHRRGGC